VIERGWIPRCRGVADRAIRRETRRDMIRIRRAGEIRLVAGVTRSRRRGVVVIRVALGACQGGMSARQRIVRIERVVKGRIQPVGVAVARIAGVREIHLHVTGVRGSVEVSRVTGIAILGNGCVVIVDMTLRTGKCGMRTQQRKD